ncbi:protein DpdD [Klebsiella sp. 1SOBk13mer]|uniref:protein DpdD n=1 Tax=Klebsiella TaxID=570 RepID=UPI00131232C6|nr:MULTISPECIES: protein DpdD [Klebsiella]MVX82115.1 hypothetical protein [Enterobacteriaceae bacterium 8376wD9]MVY25352.1 hypothetical protein [Enterobacteriaceae bacterium 8376wB8]MVY31098.1 hypothetical protein [Enterobacteriaceae bacterium 8376wD8]HCB0534130.1 hypothetical protein [Klebsiella variicola subsp. variicola]MBY7265802.1 hypothetical protein [Klebsiella variicola]
MNIKGSEQLLRNFFDGDENIISWEKIESEQLEKSTLRRLKPWIEDVRSGCFPVILPRVMKGCNDKVTWYAIADEERNYAELGELIDSHVGTSWSDFNRQRIMLNPNSSVEKALIEHYGDSVYKFSSLSRPMILEVFKGIERLRLQLANRPSHHHALLRPRGRILRDIRAALRRHDVPQTRIYLQELRDAGGIGHINELFIELRCLAMEKDAKSLLESPELRRVMDIPHPLVLAEEVMAVLYQQMLLKYELEEDLAAQRRVFNDYLANSVPRLFLVIQGIRTPAAVKNTLLWLLSDTHSAPSRLKEQAHQLVAGMEGASDNDRFWISQLLAAFPNEINSFRPIKDIDELLVLADEHPESTLEELVLLPVSAPGVAIALQCAWVVGSTGAAVKAISYLQQLVQQERDLLLAKPTFQRYYAELQTFLPVTLAVENAVGFNNWQDWLQKVLEDPLWVRAIEAVEQTSHKWPTSALETEVFISLLDKSDDRTGMILRDAIPVLLEWLDNHQGEASWQPVRLALLQQLVLDDNSSREDVIIACDLARGYLEGDINANDYRELIENLQVMIESSGTNSASAWLDILELFLIYPTVDKLAREQLFSLVYSKFYSNPFRYSKLQWNLLAQFSEECGLVFEIPLQATDENNEGISGEVQAGATLNNKVVGIYTLTEPVAQRVKKQLLADYPHADIRLNSDKGGTTILRSLAKEADLFVFAWLSSKHSAYYAIKEERGEKPFLQPSGKGSTSMLDCIRTYLKGLSA